MLVFQVCEGVVKSILSMVAATDCNNRLVVKTMLSLVKLVLD